MDAAPPRWTDDRIDELNGRVRRIEPVISEVAVLKTEMKNLSHELRANTEATQRANQVAEQVSHQLEQAKIEPLQRGRKFWGQVTIAIAGAVVAGGFAVFGALIAAGHL